MKEVKRNIKSYAAIFCILILPTLAFSQDQGQRQPPSSTNVSINLQIKNPLKGGANSLIGLLKIILDNVVMPLASVGIVLAIIYSGWKFIEAQGKPEDLRKAREGLLYVLIGAGVLLGASGISTAIEATLKQVVDF